MLVERAVVPQFAYKISRWPPQQQIANELDRLQQKMTSILLCEPMAIGEEVPEFVRRRGKIARKLCKDQGLWSQRWYSRVIKWDRHLSQSRNTYSWSSRLRTFHGSDWLILQRMSFIKAASNTVSVLAGRTGTRTFPGKVFARWHDGVNNALFHISSENLEKI